MWLIAFQFKPISSVSEVMVYKERHRVQLGRCSGGLLGSMIKRSLSKYTLPQQKFFGKASIGFWTALVPLFFYIAGHDVMKVGVIEFIIFGNGRRSHCNKLTSNMHITWWLHAVVERNPRWKGLCNHASFEFEPCCYFASYRPKLLWLKLTNFCQVKG